MRVEKPSLNSQYYDGEYLRSFGFTAIGEHVRIHKSVVLPDPPSVRIGSHVRIDAFTVLTAKEIYIGSYTHIGPNVSICGQETFICGNFCGISHGAKIFTSTDDLTSGTLTNPMPPGKYVAVQKGRVHLEDHAIAGAGSVILPGVKIFQGGYLGAMSLAKEDINKWMFAVGIPASQIKPRPHKHVDAAEEELMKRLSAQDRELFASV